MRAFHINRLFKPYLHSSKTLCAKFGTWHPSELAEGQNPESISPSAESSAVLSSRERSSKQHESRANALPKRRDYRHLQLAQGESQIKPSPPTISSGANVKFRATKIDEQISQYIEEHGLGKRRFRGRPKHRPWQNGDNYSASDAFFLKINRMRLTCSASSAQQFPSATNVSEIAFIGRSNVGKSSLINAICDSTIARVSDRPGETRSIDFYMVGAMLSLVDLPGYGFAYADDSQLESWRNLIRTFLFSRKSLRRTMVLLDARVGLKSSDVRLMETLDSWNVNYQVVFTKSDLVLPVDLARRASIVKAALLGLKRAIPEILIVSSRTRQGMSHLRGRLLALNPHVLHT